VGPIADQYGVSGNFSEDPLFCDALALNLTLNSASLCAPGNHPECGLIGAWGVGCAPPTYQVAPDGTGDYPTIQAAVDAASPGTTIELLAGIFTGEGNRDIDLSDRRVVIRSEGEDAQGCVIDCEGSVAEPHRGFIIAGGQDWRTVLERITICNGFVTGGQMGGAIYAGVGASPTITGCIFLDSEAEADGGAIAFSAGAATLQGCTFAGNVAGGNGGAIYTDDGALPTVSGSTFYGNAGTEGGGIYAGDGVTLMLENCIVAFSEAGAAVACDPTGAAQLTCCDVYGNEGGDWVGCLEGQLALEGNLAEDPGFCDAAAGIFTVYDDSPCAAEMNPTCGQIGAWGIGCNRPIFVKPDGTGAYATIQDAIDASLSGMTIELDDGVFTGAGNRDLNCRGKLLTIRSRSGDPRACVLDAQGTAGSQHLAFRFHMGETEEMVVEGITMTGGYNAVGGSVFISNTSPTFRRCVFTGNTGTSGGAVYAYYNCPAHFINCTFSHNTGGATTGGTFYLNDANFVLDNCLITNSQSGAAFYLNNSSPVLTCCDIYGNAGGDWTGILAEQLGINGNMCVDPLYCDPPAQNFMIDETSPCAPENNPECGLMGALGVGCYSSEVAESLAPRRLMLAAQVPSSAARGTTIRYAIPGPSAAHVQLSVYDAAGRLVSSLLDGPQAPGVYSLVWNGGAANGAQVGSGVYFCRLSCNGETRTRNLVLVR